MSDTTVIILLISIMLLFIILLVILMKLGKKSITDFEESIKTDYTNYKTELSKQNNILIQQLLDHQQKLKDSLENTNPHLEKSLLTTFIKLRMAIKENCANAMSSIDAARLAIYLFHNGTYSTHGINFFKISCICEKISIGNGVKERMLEHSNIPINLFDEMIEKLIDNNRYIIINDEDTKNSNKKIFISADKIKYTQLIAIYDINNNMLGFVCAEMIHPYSKELADKERDIIEVLVKQLVPVLSYSEYVELQ